MEEKWWRDELGCAAEPCPAATAKGGRATPTPRLHQGAGGRGRRPPLAREERAAVMGQLDAVLAAPLVRGHGLAVLRPPGLDLLRDPGDGGRSALFPAEPNIAGETTPVSMACLSMRSLKSGVRPSSVSSASLMSVAPPAPSYPTGRWSRVTEAPERRTEARGGCVLRLRSLGLRTQNGARGPHGLSERRNIFLCCVP